MKRFRSAFTMIELVFIIVILGILAAVGIPKLAATRDDAHISRMAHNIMTTAFEVSTYAISKGEIDDMDKISNAAELMKREGKAVITSSGVSSALYKNGAPIKDTAIFKMGQTSDCVKLVLSPQNNDNELVLDISFSSAPDELCTKLQNLIDSGKFPMRLRGTAVVY